MVWQRSGPQPALAPAQHLGVLKVTALGEDWHSANCPHPPGPQLCPPAVSDSFPNPPVSDNSLQLCPTAQPHVADWGQACSLVLSMRIVMPLQTSGDGVGTAGGDGGSRARIPIIAITLPRLVPSQLWASICCPINWKLKESLFCPSLGHLQVDMQGGAQMALGWGVGEGGLTMGYAERWPHHPPSRSSGRA